MRVVLSPPRKRKRQWVPNPRTRKVALMLFMFVMAMLTAYGIALMVA